MVRVASTTKGGTNIVNGSFGFKFAATNGFTIVTNALVPLNRGGLRANVTYTTGVEFSF